MNETSTAVRPCLMALAMVASCLGGNERASAQELLWTRERTTYADSYGSAVAITPDMDGDGRCDALVGGKYVDCTGVEDGMVEVVGGLAGGKLIDWCGDDDQVGTRVV